MCTSGQPSDSTLTPEAEAALEYQRTGDFNKLLERLDKPIKKLIAHLWRRAPGANREQVTQEVQIALHRSASNFDPSRSPRLMPLVITYARGTLAWELKRTKVVPESYKKYGIEGTSLDAPLDDEGGSFHDILGKANGESSIEVKELWKRVYFVLTDRYPSGLLYINLRFREGWSSNEIAHYFDVTRQAVNFKINRAFQILSESPNLKRWVAGKPRRWYKPRKQAKRDYGARFEIPRRDHCSRLECWNAVYLRGLCRCHYYEKRGKRCSIDGCDRPEEALGYCRVHRERFKRGTLFTPTGVKPIQIKRRKQTCKIDCEQHVDTDVAA